MAEMILRDGKVMIEDHSIGDWREATDAEKAQLNIELPDGIAAAVHQAETGETYDPTTGALNPFKRLKLTNFATDTAARARGLKAMNYDVREVDGMQWAKLAGSKTWRPVDPAMGQGGFFEPILDTLDLVTDGIKGFLSSAAGVAAAVATSPTGVFTGGAAPIAAGMATGGAVYGLAESAKQNIGEALGIPGNVDNSEAAMQGVMAAGMPPIPAPIRIPSGGAALSQPAGIIRRGVEKGEDAALSLSGRIAGTEGEMIRLRAEIPGFGKLPTGRAAVDELHGVLRAYKSGDIRIPARESADNIIAEFDKSGGTVDLEPALSRMLDFMSDAGGNPKTSEAAEGVVYDPDMPRVIGRLYANIRNYLDTEGVDIRKVPAAIGEKVKRMMQGVANSKVPYGEHKVTDQASASIKQFSRIVRAELESKVGNSGIVDPATGKSYPAVMADVSRAKKYIGKVMEGFYSGKSETAKAGRALKTMRTLFGDTGREYLDAVEMMDRELGTSVYEKVRQAAIGKALGSTFGKEGAPNIFPRFTAQGRFLNPLPTPAALMAGGGYASLGVPGAIAGAGFASPAGQLGLVKSAKAIGQLSSSALRYADRAAGPIKSGMKATLGTQASRKIALTSMSAAMGNADGLDDE